MADIDKVKRNLGRMIDGGAPESDIDAYLMSENVTPDQLRAPAAKPSSLGPSTKPPKCRMRDVRRTLAVAFV